MPFVPVPNTAEVQLVYSEGQQIVENTLYFNLGSAPTEATLLSLATDVWNWWAGNVSGVVSNAVFLNQVVATSLETATAPSVTYSAALPVNGANTNTAEPNNVTVTVSFRTNNRGRSFRGRNYFVGLCTNQVSGNSVLQSFADSLQSAYSILLSSASTFTDAWTWVVASRFSGVDSQGKPVPRTTGVSTPITAVVITDLIIDSQRRRLPGRGR